MGENKQSTVIMHFKFGENIFELKVVNTPPKELMSVVKLFVDISTQFMIKAPSDLSAFIQLRNLLEKQPNNEEKINEKQESEEE